MKISEEILTALKESSPVTKAIIWCQLNLREWPKELADLKPANFHEVTATEQLRFIWELMLEIMDSISYKECLRQWNHERLPGEKFDEWWDEQRKVVE